MVITMIFFSFNDIDLSRNMGVDSHMQWRREWGPMAALGRLWPPWLMGNVYASFSYYVLVEVFPRQIKMSAVLISLPRRSHVEAW